MPPYSTLLCGSILALALSTLSIVGLGDCNWAILFLEVISTILNCRFLLDLYETNARLERGGSSLSQSNIGTLSLHFTGIDGADAHGQEDSPFLNSFSGPVLHSFPDDDIMALDTVDDEPEAGPSIPAQTTAPATKTAAGGSSSAWRADMTGGPVVAEGSGVAGSSELAV
ncbi:hypothetical protein C2E23DRAFT_135153 [Lenzites betulinus]|nr:hypothetical protein C2E23DRAFT_135153 [Lenzites betulinus]